MTSEGQQADGQTACDADKQTDTDGDGQSVLGRPHMV